MKALLGLAAAFGLIALAPAAAAPKPKDEKKDDLKAFAGDWLFLSWESNGIMKSQEFLDECKWTVKGEKYTFTSSNQPVEEGTLKLAPDKKPATIDLDIADGMDQGKSQVGIYKIEKDQITICFAKPGQTDRPTEFSGAGDKGHILVVIKRK